ncbi:MAG TPA: hypothetical protein VGE39_01410 [Prosthecobacter sp.]
MHLGLSFFFLTLALAASADPAVTWPEQPVPSRSQRVAVLEDKRINESSGLCLSGRDPAIFWTLNDSGGEPCVFAIDRTGKTRAKVRVRDAANFDWEDVALGKDDSGAPALFVADIGDNFHLRPSLQIYQIPEPDVGAPRPVVDETESVVPKLWRFNYPDGRHNAESLLVHPLTGRLYVLTKTDNGACALYGFPQPLQAGVSMVVEKIAALAFPPVVRVGKRPHDNCMTTSAGFSPDAARLVVSTYSSLYEWALPKDIPLAEALKNPPVRIQPDLLGQMEGVCYDADGRTIWATSERLPAPLLKITRP